jgi:hypothetical protein
MNTKPGPECRIYAIPENKLVDRIWCYTIIGMNTQNDFTTHFDDATRAVVVARFITPGTGSQSLRANRIVDSMASANTATSQRIVALNVVNEYATGFRYTSKGLMFE